jgi:methyltransferase family protein
MFSQSSKNRLTHHDLQRFPGERLFDRLARAVCEAGCLPRKELYEAWELARRVRRLFRGGRIVDLAAGHGLLAHVMLLLDDSSPAAIAVDRHPPASAATLHEALTAAWPRLAGRVRLEAAPLEAFSLIPGDVVVSIHACGALTDVILERATMARVRVAVLPCCHDFAAPAARKLAGWIDDAALAIDIDRAQRLERQGYRIWTQTIPEAITPKARLLIGAPVEQLAVPGF